MKKILALVIAFTLVLTMCACTATPAENNTDTPNTPSSTPGNTTPETDISGNLLIAVSIDPASEALIEAFTTKYPNVTVDYTLWTLEEEQTQALAGPAGTGADVFVLVDNSIPTALQDGLLEPFPTELLEKLQDSMIDVALEMCMVDGELYGAPITYENIGFMYNKDLVDTPPETFEELIEFAEAYNDPSANKYALSWQVSSSFLNYFMLTAFDYEIFGQNRDDYRQFNIDSPEVTQALEFFKSLRGIFDINAVDATVEATETRFANGEVPFTITGAWQFPAFDEAGLNYGVTKFPSINGVQGRCYAQAMMACVSSYSENKEAAFAFAEFCASEEGLAIFYEFDGRIPPLKDGSNIPGFNENEHIQGLLEQAPYTDPMPSISEMNLTWVPINNMYTFVWDGTMTVQEAQAKALEEYEVALNAIGKSIND